jgi:HD superfamily phosphohydrolase
MNQDRSSRNGKPGIQSIFQFNFNSLDCNSMALQSVSPLKVGFFQTLESVSEDTVLIRDDLYGDHTISEPVLVELLCSPTLQRLIGVCQHGVSGLLGLTPKVTRFEHSVGAFLLVRKVRASVEEQVAALLHDVSHTTLSHVIDWALSRPGEGSFHEVHKARYVKTTPLPQILAKHGFGDLKALNEDLYPLVEMPSPHLCADRLDYSLRDAVSFGKLELGDAQRVFAALKAFPDASSGRRLLVLEEDQLALTLARAYLASDRDVWSNKAHIDMYRRTGQLIGEMVRRGVVKEEALWSLSDEEFWELLRSAADPNGLEAMKRLESEGLPKEDDLGLPQGAKVRTLDPDILLSTMQESLPLSIVRPEWALERQDYISSREVERV